MSRSHDQSDAANLAKTGNKDNASAAKAADAPKQAEAVHDPAALEHRTLTDAPVEHKTVAQEETNLAARMDRDNAAVLRHEDMLDRDTLVRRGYPPAEGVEFKAPDGSILKTGAVSVEGDPSTDPEAMLAQHKRVDFENEQRDAQNAEPFAKKMEAEERRVVKAAEVAAELPPPTGKQRDVNTPYLDAAGNATWR